jgi:hypothetical protein
MLDLKAKTIFLLKFYYFFFRKENPIVEQLISDKTIMVSGMTLADWMEYTEQSLASGN